LGIGRRPLFRYRLPAANKNTELDQLRADVPTLVRTINVLTLENQQLREAHTQTNPTVVPFPPRHGPHAHG
jgi:hypothetical protein